MRGKNLGLLILTVELNSGPASTARPFIDSLSPESSPVRVAHDHSHCPVLAPATLAALQSTRAIPDRDVFYVTRVPAAPLIRSCPRDSSVAHTDLTVHVARAHGSIPELEIDSVQESCSR